ncbi:MarR family winged helix-turn-helix transcriptional regulator [Actinacidiphila acidipaludis]|uniref:MarR family transcriptional regulator n=1 Tax=Actinacidiphila acidipaludis TaxID=2873382 RepID=A0ABS7QFR0_9ACTN|nr:MarR family transcriptional regulator [Streptomyces acidipaludis]MBY8881998.1 MarR family transcriptional regulator [Streptomyces acidipaludis]
MSTPRDAEHVATTLLSSISVLVRRIRLLTAEGELTMPERRALSLLDRGGPATSAELARQEQITAQAMGATLGRLQRQDLISRSADPRDGRRVVLTVTDAGRAALKRRRSARSERLTAALTSGAFTEAELEQLAAAAPLLERLAQSV